MSKVEKTKDLTPQKIWGEKKKKKKIHSGDDKNLSSIE